MSPAKALRISSINSCRVGGPDLVGGTGAVADGTSTGALHFGQVPRFPACSSLTRKVVWHESQVVAMGIGPVPILAGRLNHRPDCGTSPLRRRPKITERSHTSRWPE